MAVDERARRHLYERLDDILGHEAADTLMEELTFIGREQLARRHDIELLRRDMDASFAEIRAEFRGEMNTGFAELRAEMATRFDRQTRQIVFAMIGALFTVAALAVGSGLLG